MPRKSRSSKMRGGRVVFPSEFYGNVSGRYHAAGSAELSTCGNAYGKNVSVSHGVVHPSGSMMGPNIAPSPNTSYVQTAGGKGKKVKFNKSPQKRSRRQSRSNRLTTRNKTPPPSKSRKNRSRSKSRSSNKNRRSKSRSSNQNRH
jgi:hypothetical protein